MTFPSIHSWDLTPQEAIALQKHLASRIVLKDDFNEIRTVAGADLSIDAKKQVGYAGVILFEFPGLRVIERASAEGALLFPYIPGLLSFREGPILLKAFEKLGKKPDLALFDGQGIAHPRRLGIASHMGLLLDIPSIGCGKSLLCGSFEEPGPSKGDSSPLMHKGERIGTVFRTRDHVKPMFISPGHRISLETAVTIVSQCSDGYRLPKPTREADRWVSTLKQPAPPCPPFESLSFLKC